jgi:hypothetical protein
VAARRASAEQVVLEPRAESCPAAVEPMRAGKELIPEQVASTRVEPMRVASTPAVPERAAQQAAARCRRAKAR